MKIYGFMYLCFFLLPIVVQSIITNLTFADVFHGGAVLQRGVEVIIYGTSGEKEVTLHLDQHIVYTAKVGTNNQWIAYLPSQIAAFNKTIVAHDASGFVQITVSFGDVILCSGQSNMGMDVGPYPPRNFDADNGAAESANAGRYTGRIWLKSRKSRYPNATSWFSVTSQSLPSFSAVCWYTGKALFEHQGGKIPFGLIMAAIGGTAIELWIPAPYDWISTCKVTTPCGKVNSSEYSRCYNNTVSPNVPYTVRGMIWDQAEADVGCDHINLYPCLQKRLVKSWRSNFNSSFPFVAVQLPGYSEPLREKIFSMRLAQDTGIQGIPKAAITATYDLSCSNPDHCPHGFVHNVHKQPIGARLALQLRHLMYGEEIISEGPRVTHWTSTLTKVTNIYSVNVSFSGGTDPYFLKGTRNCTECCKSGDFDASTDGEKFFNGSIATMIDSVTVQFKVELSKPPTVVRYTANNAFPQCALYNKEGLPALPFQMAQ